MRKQAKRRVTKHFRMRRGKLVEIPEEWVGRTLKPQVKRHRLAKHPRKMRSMRDRWMFWVRDANGNAVRRSRRHPRTWAPRLTRGRARNRLRAELREHL